MSLEYITLSSYLRSKGRRLLDRNFRLDYWMPIYMRPEHGTKAAPLMEEFLSSLLLKAPQTALANGGGTERPFLPAMAPIVLPTLMNSMVVRRKNARARTPRRDSAIGNADRGWLCMAVRTYAGERRQGAHASSCRTRVLCALPSLANPFSGKGRGPGTAAGLESVKKDSGLAARLTQGHFCVYDATI